VKTLTQIRATSAEGLLVAFGRCENGPENIWCMLFDAGSLATIARSGQEVVFTARELTAPTFNPHLHWVVTLLFRTEADAKGAESNLRTLRPAEFFQNEDLTGIIAYCGHSFQSVGVPSSKLEAIAKRRGLTLTLVSAESSEHRDYYAVSERV
jgi:hypothetical protein